MMALRWRYKINALESLYYAATGFSCGMSLNAQFVGLTASAPAEKQGTAIGIYYLSQQIGIILGTGSFAALLQMLFKANLRQALGSISSADEVSNNHRPRAIHFTTPLLPHRHPSARL